MDLTSSDAHRERDAPPQGDARVKRVLARAQRYCDASEVTPSYQAFQSVCEARNSNRKYAYFFMGGTYTRNMLVCAFMQDRQVLDPQSNAYFTTKQVATYIKKNKTPYDYDPDDSEPEPSTENEGRRDPHYPLPHHAHYRRARETLADVVLPNSILRRYSPVRRDPRFNAPNVLDSHEALQQALNSAQVPPDHLIGRSQRQHHR